jgi:hypothetical protein
LLSQHIRINGIDVADKSVVDTLAAGALYRRAALLQ